MRSPFPLRTWVPRSLSIAVALGAVVAVIDAADSGSAPIDQGDGPPLAGTQPSDGRGTPGFPHFSNEGGPGQFLNPSRCQSCHAGFRQEGQTIYEPFDAWAGSMMANASRDPLFWAALDVANQDDRKHLGNVGVGDFCLRCHVPKGWYEGRSDCNTAWGQKFDGSCFAGSFTRRDSDFEGITCHVCHRAYDAKQPDAGDFYDPDAPRLENGQLYISDNSWTNRGPFSDSLSPGHNVLASEIHRSAQFCGQCHNVTNPVKKARDRVSGAELDFNFPIERTYREWQQSLYATRDRNCQSCHMPSPDFNDDGIVDDGVACNSPPGPRGEHTRLEGPLHVHFFRGGSSWMQGVLEGEYGAALNRIESFEAGIAASNQLMKQAAAVSFYKTLGAARPGTLLKATVRVVNHSGHKFPTGYAEGRRAWIHLKAGGDLDGNGRLDPSEISFESNTYDPDTGQLDTSNVSKVYETKQGVFDFNGTGTCDTVDATGDEMFHFTLNDCVSKDNRIPPEGFTPDDETRPAGYLYPLNPNLPGALAHWDDTAYKIPVPNDGSKRLIIVAELFYQSSSKEYIEFLKRENESSCDPRDAGCNPTIEDERPNRGEKMHTLWERYGRSAPVLIGSSTQWVRIGTVIGKPGPKDVPIPTGNGSIAP